MDLLENIEHNKLQVDESVTVHFKEIIGWSKFLAIAGMILSVLVVVFSFALGARIESALNSGFMDSGTAGFLVILALIVFAVTYFTFSYFLYSFANKMQLAVDTADKFEFINAMRSLRNTYKIMGILLVVYVSLFLFNSFMKFI